MKKIFGFTLIELLIAVAIIAILTAIGVVSYQSVNKRSRDAKRYGDMEQIRSALEMYRSDNGFYPPINTNGFATAANLNTSLNVDGGYIPAIPTDPQPSAHIYYFKANNLDNISGNYYGYCLCAWLESQASSSSTCSGETLPAQCLYGVRNP